MQLNTNNIPFPTDASIILTYRCPDAVQDVQYLESSDRKEQGIGCR